MTEGDPMTTRRTARAFAVAIVAAIGLVAAACAPTAPGGGGQPAPINWKFEGDSVTVNNSQDETCFILCVNKKDEPYLLQIAFKVTIGEPGSAQAWRVGSGSNAHDESISNAFTGHLGVGESYTFVGAERATATFTGIQPLDVLDALNPNNKMDIVGVYSWSMESDLVSYDNAADSIAAIFGNALNATLAEGTLPSDEQALVDMVIDLLFNNIGNAFSVLLANVPLLGAGDDTLGGAVYLGLGATGVLGSAIDAVLGGVSIPNLTLLGDNKIPPGIQGGKMFTMTGAKSFNQTFTGADGQHTYRFLTGPT